jgi:hypothetical protein
MACRSPARAGSLLAPVVRMRTSALPVITLTVILALPALTAAQTLPPPSIGSIFAPAHTPDGNITAIDIHRALLQTAGVGDHASYMHHWFTGDEGLSDLAFLVPGFRQLGRAVFLQVAPTILGQPQPPGGLPPSFADARVRARYLADVQRLAQYMPDYLNLCAEADLIFAFAPAEGAAYATLYREAYALVKRISPATRVGVSYHLDAMFGFNHLWIADYLGPQDYIGITTYPASVVYERRLSGPAALPASYYDRLRAAFPTQPLVIAEIGWPAEGLGTPTEQADFIWELPRLMKVARPELVTWTMLSDTRYFRVSMLDEIQRRILDALKVDPALLFRQFNSMGLVDWDGAEKPAYRAWRDVVF